MMNYYVLHEGMSQSTGIEQPKLETVREIGRFRRKSVWTLEDCEWRTAAPNSACHASKN